MQFNRFTKEFIEERNYRGLSPATIKGYQDTFKMFEQYLLDEGLSRVEQVTTRVAKGFMFKCKEIGNNPVTLNTKLKQLKALFNWGIEEDIVETNPFKAITKVREDSYTTAFTDKDVKMIISYLKRRCRLEKHFPHIAKRNYYLFLTFISTGLRRGEVCNLKWSDLDLQNAIMRVYGKARKEQFIPVSDLLIKELLSWKAYNIEQFGELPTHIFMDVQKKPLNVDGVRNFFQRLSGVVGLNYRCSAHVCRHYFAKTYIQSGGDIKSLSRILRHTTIRTTERYLNMSVEDLQRSNEQFNPLNKLL